jgi:hypothetical protein
MPPMGAASTTATASASDPQQGPPLLLGVDLSTQSITSVIVEAGTHKLVASDCLNFDAELGSKYGTVNGMIVGAKGKVTQPVMMWLEGERRRRCVCTAGGGGGAWDVCDICTREERSAHHHNPPEHTHTHSLSLSHTRRAFIQASTSSSAGRTRPCSRACVRSRGARSSTGPSFGTPTGCRRCAR